MEPLRAWICFSALILVVSLAVHFSTFFGINPMQAVPYVMLLHVAIFPPFIAAIVYMNKLKSQGLSQDNVFKFTPQWMRVMSGACFIYAILNFIIFILLVHGGSPTERDGKFYLSDHGRIIKELSEAEFQQMQTYVVRGFSGHWILFSGLSMALLTGALNFQKKISAR